MRWDKFRKSDNVEDVRGQTSRSGGFGRRSSFGGGGRRLSLPRGRGGKVSIWGIIIMLGVAWLLGINPLTLLMGGDVSLNQPSSSTYTRSNNTQAYQSSEAETRSVNFTKAVLGSTEDIWHGIFREMKRDYREPRLQIFKGLTTQTACGQQTSAVGPFYCPPDRKIFIDLDFFSQMQREFGVKGEFAHAYVIAHEVGHHVQNILGISGKVQQQKSRLPKEEANKLSVKLELQADCFAGVWAKRAEDAVGFLEPGDVAAALKAASAIGDDNLQKKARGFVVPESFTHGSSKQRVEWFSRGLKHGDVNQCNTFSG